MKYLQYFKDLEMRRAGVLPSSDLKASEVCAGQGRHNISAKRWGTKSLTSFCEHQLQRVPRAAKMLRVRSFSFPPLCFTCSHPAPLFQPSHHCCREPHMGAGSHLNHRQRSQARTVCITHITQTLIHCCPGTAMIQTEWSCQKKISPCQVWHLYVSWEHVVVTGIHTADNMTNFSSFARHWDEVWKLCWKELPTPPWWSRSMRQGTRGARKYVVLPACSHLRKPFPMGAQWDCTRETEPRTYPTSVHWRPSLQWTSFALQ